MVQEPILRPEEVASVLAGEAVGEATAVTATAPDPTPLYSLRRPVFLSPERLPEARKRLETLADALQQTLRHELQAEIEVEVQGFQQDEARTAIATLPGPVWTLAFLHQEGGGLALVLEPTCALAMVELALGGVGTSGQKGREPTTLERRVLDKLCGSVASELASRCKTAFARGAFTYAATPNELASPGQTLGVGLARVRVASTDRSAVLLATAGVLAEPSAPRVRSAAHVGPLAPLLGGVRCRVRPVLPGGIVALGDLMKLEPQAVLRLDVAETAALELRVEGIPIFDGRMSREGGVSRFDVGRRRGRAAPLARRTAS
jgi:flagellar motor switch protein FliM